MRAYKVEIELNEIQKEKFYKTIGTCRFIYNLFLDINKKLYEENKETENKKYMDNYEFSKWLNNEYILNNPDKKWIKEVSSKSIRNSIDNANLSFKKFFKKQSAFPRFKKKGINDCGMYFVKTDSKTIIKCERHRIKIPTLGWCKMKEYGYIPTNSTITSGTITTKAGRYYVSVLTKEDIEIEKRLKTEGIGIDLGIKELAIVSNGDIYPKLRLRKQERRLKREQRKYSKKLKFRKGETTKTSKNLCKQRLKIERAYQRISNIRRDYENKVVNSIVKQEPSFITIEDLNIKGMMKNKHLSKSIQSQRWNSLINKLKFKCGVHNIELRQVSRFYPSSKTCHNCGYIKRDLTLKDRIFKCECCGMEIDRDYNASLNLRDNTRYEII